MSRRGTSRSSRSSTSSSSSSSMSFSSSSSSSSRGSRLATKPSKSSKSSSRSKLDVSAINLSSASTSKSRPSKQATSTTSTSIISNTNTTTVSAFGINDTRATDHNLTELLNSDNAQVEEQLLGFSRRKFLDNVAQAAIDYIDDGLDALERTLKQVSRASKHKKKVSDAHIGKGTKVLTGQLQTSFNKSMDKFEKYMVRNVLMVPSEVLQHEQTLLDNNETAALASDIQELRKQILAERYLSAAFDQEEERLDQEFQLLQDNQQEVNALNEAIQEAQLDAPLHEKLDDIVSNNVEIKENLLQLAKYNVKDSQHVLPSAEDVFEQRKQGIKGNPKKSRFGSK